MSEADARPMMTCGHAANATEKRDGAVIPACAICFCTEIATDPPNLDGRQARCAYAYGRDKKPCHKLAPSSTGLPFFEYLPNEEFDRYYCGCWGWD